MSSIYKTWEQHLQDLTSPEVHATAYESGSPSGQPQEQAPTPQQQTTATLDTPLTPAPGSYAAPGSGQIEGIGSTYTPSAEATGVYKDLFKPVSSELGTQVGALGGAVGAFNQQAKPYGTFGGEQQGVLESALQGGSSSPDWKTSQGWLAGAYTAPKLDQGALDTIAQSLRGSLGPEGKALDTSAGARELLTRSHSDLTPGEGRFEAPRVAADAGYQAGAEGLQTDIAKFWGDYLKAQGQAGAIGEKGASSAKDLQTKATGFLTGKEDTLKAGWGGKAKEAEAQQKTIQDALTSARSTGDWRQLQNIPESARSGWNPSDFGTPDVLLREEGLKARADVMAKYPDIKDVPVMERGTNSKGKEAYRFPDAWFEANKGKYTAEQMKALKAQVRKRDLELEATGFSPVKEAPLELRYNNAEGTEVDPQFEVGKYSNVLPEWFGSDWTPANPADYVGFAGGSPMTPTAENVAPQGEIDYYNTIQSLLNDPRTISNVLPYKAQVTGDTKGYQDDNAASMGDQQASIQKAIQDYLAAGGMPGTGGLAGPDPVMSGQNPLPITRPITPQWPNMIGPSLPFNEQMIQALLNLGRL